MAKVQIRPVVFVLKILQICDLYPIQYQMTIQGLCDMTQLKNSFLSRISIRNDIVN